ncbi:MAG: O-acetylhomoserine aminocarboxypropyltransferase/cysteine synthase [Alphaproteobacteria bacterium]|nr:O-acetylhomoserine aminocarboxypropyltransferase/cysteine synthase [Alphaproteobacteria bacterium]
MAPSKHAQTLSLHAGYRCDPATGSVAVPINMTSAYQFQSTEHAAKLFTFEEQGNIYTRITNPTVEILEKRLAAIEGGSAALALASGQAAAFYAIQNVARAGDNFVSSTELYGGTYNMFKTILRAQGIEARFVDPSDPENFRRATDSKTRAYFAETLPNPKLNVFPIAEVAEIGKSFGLPLIVDNTAAPLLCRPFEHGAAVVLYSLTKWIAGHGNSLGGALIESGAFDWSAVPERLPAFNAPDPSYHDVVWSNFAKPFGPVAFTMKGRGSLMLNLGSCLSPFNAFLIMQGLETLALRMRAHSENASAVAAYLNEHPSVARVIHPSLATGAAKARATKYLKGGFGGLVGFELKGDALMGKKFIDALKLFYHVANIGDTRSLATHPASTTHSQLLPEEQIAAGVSPGYVRLSVGIEHIDDILSDLTQALQAAGA